MAVVHLPLHLLIHSLSCFPSIPSGFYLGRTLEHHQLLLFCRAVAQCGALGPAQITQLNWLWAHFLTGLVRSCRYSENQNVGLLKLNNTFIFIICYWSNQVRVFSGDLKVPLVGTKPGSTLRGKKKRNDKYAAFQPTTPACPNPYITLCSLNQVVLELIKKDLTGRHLNKEERNVSPPLVHLS